MGQQEVHEYEASGGGFERRLYCRLTSGLPDPANKFAHKSYGAKPRQLHHRLGGTHSFAIAAEKLLKRQKPGSLFRDPGSL